MSKPEDDVKPVFVMPTLNDFLALAPKDIMTATSVNADVNSKDLGVSTSIDAVSVKIDGEQFYTAGCAVLFDNQKHLDPSVLQDAGFEMSDDGGVTWTFTGYSNRKGDPDQATKSPFFYHAVKITRRTPFTLTMRPFAKTDKNQILMDFIHWWVT